MADLCLPWHDSSCLHWSAFLPKRALLLEVRLCLARLASFRAGVPFALADLLMGGSGGGLCPGGHSWLIGFTV